MDLLAVSVVYRPDDTWFVAVTFENVVYSGSAATLEAAMAALRADLGSLPEAALPFTFA